MSRDGDRPRRQGRLRSRDVRGDRPALRPSQPPAHRRRGRGWRTERRCRACRSPPAGASSTCAAAPATSVSPLRSEPELRVTGVDFCDPMLDGARLRGAAKDPAVPGRYLWEPIARCPLPTAASTVRYGIFDAQRGRYRRRRSRRRGGYSGPDARFVNLDVTQAAQSVVRRLFESTFTASFRSSAACGGSKSAYRYLPNSLTNFPDADALAQRFRGPASRGTLYAPWARCDCLACRGRLTVLERRRRRPVRPLRAGRGLLRDLVFDRQRAYHRGRAAHARRRAASGSGRASRCSPPKRSARRAEEHLRWPPTWSSSTSRHSSTMTWSTGPRRGAGSTPPLSTSATASAFLPATIFLRRFSETSPPTTPLRFPIFFCVP